MGLSDQPFEVMCPDCGAMLKVDPVTRAIISHKSAPKKKMFEDFGEAADPLHQRLPLLGDVVVDVVMLA